MCFAPQRRALFRHLNFQKKVLRDRSVFNTFNFQMCFAPQRRALFRSSQLPKVLRDPSVFNTFWLPNLLRATTACTFPTSQLPKGSAPRPSVFNTFNFQMCFAPQRRALFRHLNFQKLLRTPQFLTHFTSKSASRHNAVHFFNISTSKSGPIAEVFCTFSLRNRLRATTSVQLFISHLPRCLRTRRFSEPTFQPSGATKPRKNKCFATFLPFRAPASSFFWSFLFWLFSLLTAFSSLHIVGSLLLNFLRPINYIWLSIYLPKVMLWRWLSCWSR